jgi:hypothetical protein
MLNINLVPIFEVKIERFVYKINLGEEIVGSLKLDIVRFPKDYKDEYVYYECEVSTETTSDEDENFLREIGYALKRKYHLHATSMPKVEVITKIQEERDLTFKNEDKKHIHILKRKDMTLVDIIKVNRSHYEREKLKSEQIKLDFEEFISFIEKKIGINNKKIDNQLRIIDIKNKMEKISTVILKDADLHNKIKTWKYKLANANAESVIKDILDYCIIKKLAIQNDVINISAMFHNNEQRKRSGIDDLKNAQLELNRINSAILNLIDNLCSNDDSEQSLPENAS